MIIEKEFIAGKGKPAYLRRISSSLRDERNLLGGGF